MTFRFSRGWDNHGQRRVKGIRVGSLWYSPSHEDGEVTFYGAFDELTDVMKIDLIDDFIGLLTRERDELLRQYPDEVCIALNWPTSAERNANAPAPKLNVIEGGSKDGE